MAKDEEWDAFEEEEEEEDSGSKKDGDRSALIKKVLKYVAIIGIIIFALGIQWMIAEVVHYINFSDIIKKEKEKYKATLAKESFSLGKMQFSLITPRAYIHFDDLILAIDKEYEDKKDDLGFQKAKIQHILQKVIASKTYDELKYDDQRKLKLKPDLIKKINAALGYEDKIIVDIYMPGVRVFKAPN